VDLAAFRLAQHEANAGAIEEGQAREPKEKRNFENVAVERDGAVQVRDVDGDLSKLGEHWAPV